MRRLSAVLAVALIVLVCSVAFGQSSLAAGTLAAHDGRDIYDWELAYLVSAFIGTNYESMIFAFTECFGADKFDNLLGLPNTALLSGSAPGKTSEYGGYHRALAGALAPGTTTDAAHAAGVAGAKPGDSPTKAGANVPVGGSTSTHVLVWAGKPNAQDQADINDIRNNFNGPNQTVTVLAGDGTGADGAATLQNLVLAMLGIGLMMNPNEQFVFFGTDHGDLDDTWWHKLCESGGCYFAMNTPAFDAMVADPDNEPSLTLFTEDPLPEDYLDIVMVNGFDLGAQPEPLEIDYEDDAIVDYYQYIYPVDESTLVPAGNNVLIEFSDPAGSIEFPFIALQSGAISRTTESTGLDVEEESSWGVIKSLYR
ncbi:MAG: hypothetical protein JXB46_07505 [Candidatus Eisenbacteria bacterium]|nr:hypothetical protein [Candidatus Eisenbacteria bacterium]